MELIKDLINQDFINQMPGLFVLMDLESKFLAVNKVAINWAGFKSEDNMLTRTYYDMHCKASEQHEFFSMQDRIVQVKKKECIKILGYYCYANDEWKVLFGEKYPFKKNGEIIGSISYFNDITKYKLVDLYNLLNLISNKNSTKIQKQQVNYTLEEGYPGVSLSARQVECLFFLLRGKTGKEIAKILNLSIRTIEGYIDQIKIKFNCMTKSELIEKAIEKGFMNIIPETLFNQFK